MARILAVVALLSGCSLFPLQEADCRGVNWRSRGYADGLAGHPRQDLRLVPECARLYGVEVAVADYHAGWREGYDEWYRLIGSMDRRR